MTLELSLKKCVWNLIHASSFVGAWYDGTFITFSTETVRVKGVGMDLPLMHKLLLAKNGLKSVTFNMYWEKKNCV